MIRRVVASERTSQTLRPSAVVFGDTRLALTKRSNRVPRRRVYMHLRSLIGYEVSSEFKALIASLVRGCSSFRARRTNSVSLQTHRCSPEWPPEEAAPLNINAMCLEIFFISNSGFVSIVCGVPRDEVHVENGVPKLRV